MTITGRPGIARGQRRMKVVIDAQDRRVEVDSGDAGWDAKAASRALELWRAMDGTPSKNSAPAYGFTRRAERAGISP